MGTQVRGKNVLTAIAVAVVLVASALVSAGTVSPAVAGANEPIIDHPSLVPDRPERGYPVILDTPKKLIFTPNCPNGCERRRGTYAVNLVGNYLVSGGDFLSVRRQDGTVVSSPYMTIVDTRTKQLVCESIQVDDEVLAIVPGPDPDSMIIGGRFKRIIDSTGVDRSRNRTAKIDIDTCTVDTAWNIGAVSSRVDEMAVSGNRLFIGGSFTSVAGFPIAKLAEVNFTTAAVNPNFSFDFNVYAPVVAIGASPDGTRLGIVHRATFIDGNAMRGTAIFDISSPQSPTITPHRMRTSIPAYTQFSNITNGDVAADFSSFAIAGGTATVADYITKIPTGETSNQFSWQHYMRDSNFSVAISNNAVYAGGHFCYVDLGPGQTDVMAPNTGPSSCTGTRLGPGAWRSQLAALDLNNGTPLAWNPGSNANRGVGAMTVVPRGLLVGHDGSRIDQLGIGTTGFFDFGAPNEPPPPPPPPPAGQTCTLVANGNGTVTLTWTSITGENKYSIRRNNSWVTNIFGLTTTTPGSAADQFIIRSKMGGVTTNTTCG